MFRVRNLVNTIYYYYYYNNETHMHVHVAEREWSVKGRREHNEKREGFKKRNDRETPKVKVCPLCETWVTSSWRMRSRSPSPHNILIRPASSSHIVPNRSITDG